MPKPMLIKTDSHGEKHITNIKQQDSARMTIERIKQIQNMEAIADFQELQNLPTHEKIIWLKNTLDKNTRNITLGANQIMVSRDSLVQDAMA